MEQRVKLSEKVSYAAYNFGQTSLSMFVSTYIMYYYTDVLLIPAVIVSQLLLFGRLFDGIVDPFIGYFMDRNKKTGEKYKGYIIKAAPLLIIFSILLFTPLPLGVKQAVPVCFFTYILWSACFSVLESSGGALAVSLSANEEQRRQLSTFRMVSSILATLLATFSVQLLVQGLGGGNEKQGYFYTMLLFASVSFFMIMPAPFILKERNYKTTNRLSVKKCLTVLTKNKRLILFILMYSLNQIASTMKSQMAIYYFKYAFDSIELVSIFFLIGRLASLSAQPFILYLSKRVKIINLMIFGYFFAAAPMLCVLFVKSSPWTIIMLCSISSLFSAFPANLAFTYSAQIADEISNISDNSFSGIVVSLIGLSSRIGSSLGGFIAVGVLALADYVPNVQITGTAMLALQISFIGLTVAAYSLSGISAIIMKHVKPSDGGI